MRTGTGNVFLVRHGEVRNPDRLVYADLPGFSLSASGRQQAAEVADHLPHQATILASPLDRAVETAQIIASHTDGHVVVDDALTEWALASRWAGCIWDELDESFPGELAAYLGHPEHLPFSPEPLVDLAQRVGGAVRRHRDESEGPLIFVSHQDPIQAARLSLTGRPLARLNRNKPKHAEAIELAVVFAEPWIESGSWAPDQEQVFPPARSNPSSH